MNSITSNPPRPPPLALHPRAPDKPQEQHGATKGGPAAFEPKARFQDTFEKAGSAAKQGANTVYSHTLGQVAQDTAIDKSLKSGTGVVGKGFAAGGVGLGGLGIAANAYGLGSAIKAGDQNEITKDSLGLAKSVGSTVRDSVNLATQTQSNDGFNKILNEAANLLGEGGHGKDSPVTKGISQAASEAFHQGKAVTPMEVKTAIATQEKGGRALLLGAADFAGDHGFKSVQDKIKNGVASKGEALLNKASPGGNAVQDAFNSAKHVGTQLTEANGGKTVADTAGKVLKGADTAADAAKGASTAIKLGAETAGAAARAMGRFAPGANVAMAGIDTAIAARNLADPKASIADKVTSSVAAAGSIVSATNVPIVSQVGATVSMAATAAGVAYNGIKAIIDNKDQIKDGLKKGAEVVGGGLKKGAEVVGDGLKKGAEEVKKGAEVVGDKIKEGFQKFAGLFKR